jgi:multiple sugar transport system ATP-binding protein
MTMGDRVAVTKAGVLQALGDSQHLYDNPAARTATGWP